MSDLAYKIRVMQAALEGKKIQCRSLVEKWDWSEYQSGSLADRWDWSTFDYRIAPEPRKPWECWVIFPEGSDYARVIGMKKLGGLQPDMLRVENGDHVVHMREVIEDDYMVDPRRMVEK